MKRIDLGLTREILGKIGLPDGTEIIVREPTLGQIIDFEGLRGKYVMETKKLEDEGNFEALYTKQNEFFLDEVLTFVPDMKREDVKNMTRKQRDAVIGLIFPKEEPKETQEEETKKNEEEKEQVG